MILLGDSVARRRGLGMLCVLVLLDVVDLKLLGKLRIAAVCADGDYRSGAEVVFDADGAVGEVKVFLHDGQPWSRMDTVASGNRACMKFSETSRITV